MDQYEREEQAIIDMEASGQITHAEAAKELRPATNWPPWPICMPPIRAEPQTLGVGSSSRSAWRLPDGSVRPSLSGTRLPGPKSIPFHCRTMQTSSLPVA